MSDFLSTGLAWLKLSPVLLAVLALVVASMLWAPAWYIDGLGLKSFIEENRKYLGVAFLGFTAGAVAPALVVSFRKAVRSIQVLKLKHKAKQRLQNLTPEEKAILRRFIDRDSRAQELDIGSGVTTALVKANIISAAGLSGTSIHYFEYTPEGMMGPYNIQPWSWDYLQKNKSLLD